MNSEGPIDLNIKNNKEESKRDKAHLSLLNIAFTAINALSAAASAVAAAYLLNATREQNLYNLTSNERRDRAYIAFEGAHKSDVVASGLIIQAFIKNVGTTPAYNVVQKIHQYPVKLGPLGNISMPSEFPDKMDSKAGEIITFLGPGVELPLANNSEVITPKDLRDFNAGASSVLVYGAVYYDDVFDRHHTTKFCVFFERGDVNSYRICNRENMMN